MNERLRNISYSNNINIGAWFMVHDKTVSYISAIHIGHKDAC